MNKFEKIGYAGIVLAAVGIVAFWVFGFNNDLEASEWSLFSAGVSAWIGLISLGLNKLRFRWMYN